MNRILGKLVAFATLGAYFFLNTNLSLALAFYPQSAAPTCANAEREGNAPKGCSRCSKKSAQTTPVPTSCPDKERSQNSTEPKCPNCPCDGKHCPVPGGCASCNPAKVPCLLPPSLIGQSTELVGVLDFCHDFMFLPPFLDSQVRPPRS